MMLIFAVYRKGMVTNATETDFETWQAHSRADLVDYLSSFLISFGVIMPIEILSCFVCFHFLGMLKILTENVEKEDTFDIEHNGNFKTNKPYPNHLKYSSSRFNTQPTAPLPNGQVVPPVLQVAPVVGYGEYDSDHNQDELHAHADALRLPNASSWGKLKKYKKHKICVAKHGNVCILNIFLCQYIVFFF